jgi:uncharacterized protein (TIGR02147 family)
MINIFDYSDYRTFLKDYYQQCKNSHTRFSYRYLAQKAGINSPSFFKQVIEGHRNLTKATCLKACKALGLNGDEAKYFEDLVFFNQAKNMEEKDQYFGRIVHLQKSANIRNITEDEYAYFTAWYHCVIRELVTFVDFKEDFAVLARHVTPHITEEQARQ